MRWQTNTFFEQLPVLVQQASLSAACFPWPSKSKDSRGYGLVKHQRKMFRVSRLVLAMKLGRPISNEINACHTCDNPSCINPRHLFEGSDQENMSDKTRKGRQGKGTDMPASKLTENDVREILRLLTTGMSQRDIAQQYGVGANTISHINTGFTWGWLTGRIAHNIRRKDPTLR
jgi:hypothetical protein